MFFLIFFFQLSIIHPAIFLLVSPSGCVDAHELLKIHILIVVGFFLICLVWS